LGCGFTDEVFITDECLRSDVGKDASEIMETQSPAALLANAPQKAQRNAACGTKPSGRRMSG
jgi:hypothetical protein